jgi:hypothetical protein
VTYRLIPGRHNKNTLLDKTGKNGTRNNHPGPGTNLCLKATGPSVESQLAKLTNRSVGLSVPTWRVVKD